MTRYTDTSEFREMIGALHAFDKFVNRSKKEDRLDCIDKDPGYKKLGTVAWLACSQVEADRTDLDQFLCSLTETLTSDDPATWSDDLF